MYFIKSELLRDKFCLTAAYASACPNYIAENVNAVAFVAILPASAVPFAVFIVIAVDILATS